MKSKTRRVGVGALAIVALSMLSSTPTWAWGPARPLYTMQNPADHATFNSITDNAAVGDERDFVRIVEKGVGNTYTSELTIEPGKQYEVYIYFHNDASETYNDLAHNQVGVAMETKLISDFPDKLAKNERGAVIGKIVSTTTSPAAVWDEAYITAKEAMTLHYVNGSAKIYNHWNQSGTMISTDLFSPEGTYLGTSVLNGIIFGCDRFSGSVTYTIQTAAVSVPKPEPEPEEPDPEPEPEPEPDPEEPDPEPEPEEPDPEPTPDPLPDEPEPEVPEVPDELPTTGPIEIILAVVVVVAIVAGGAYWWKTHRDVKKTTKKAKGRK